ncbi:MAG: FAD-dependent oxidoreductase [archaeon]
MKFVVKEVIRVTSRVVVLRLETEKPFHFRPGQFIQVLLEHGGKKVRKAYSIASSAKGGRVIELCVRIVEGGFASNYLANVKPGQALDAEGPFGNFILQDEISNDLIFLAAGAGIAALKPMIHEALRKKASHDIWLFFGVRTEDDILYRVEFEALASSNKNFHFVPVLSKSDNPDYEHGYVHDAFKKMIKPENQDVYICGFQNMVDDAKAACRELHFPDGKVHFEKFV